MLARSWRLLKPYFTVSEERHGARVLLAGVLVLSILQTETGVLSTYWSNLLFDSFQQKDERAFLALVFTWERLPGGWIMPGFLALALFQVVLGSVLLFAMQMLQIRWRRWMTAQFLADWLGDDAFYRLSLAGGADNPDQRLSDDIAGLTGAGANAIPDADTLSLLIGLVNAGVSLVSYTALLWVLSGGIALFGLHVPGLMVWVALLFSAGSTLLTWVVGRPLVGLRFWQQRVEADFRFGLVRVRENADAIALSRGGMAENEALLGSFEAVRGNFVAILRRMLLLNVTSVSYGQAAVVLPQLLIAPLFFAGAVMLGTMVQIGQAFGEVQVAFSWFADRFTDIARWRAALERVEGFREAGAGIVRGSAGVSAGRSGFDGFSLENVSVWLPDGTALASGFSLALARGVDVLITGEAGVGKSTLFKVLAGVWPFLEGNAIRAEGRVLFLPQRGYVPQGSLYAAVCYPAAGFPARDEEVRGALEDVGLGRFVGLLREAGIDWGQRLSAGEQQRLAVARALLGAPAWLFLDEAMSALDGDEAGRLYGLLKSRLVGVTIVSVSHDAAVGGFHGRRLVLRGRPWVLG